MAEKAQGDRTARITLYVDPQEHPDLEAVARMKGHGAKPRELLRLASLGARFEREMAMRMQNVLPGSGLDMMSIFMMVMQSNAPIRCVQPPLHPAQPSPYAHQGFQAPAPVAPVVYGPSHTEPAPSAPVYQKPVHPDPVPAGPVFSPQPAHVSPISQRAEPLAPRMSFAPADLDTSVDVSSKQPSKPSLSEEPVSSTYAPQAVSDSVAHEPVSSNLRKPPPKPASQKSKNNSEASRIAKGFLA